MKRFAIGMLMTLLSAGAWAQPLGGHLYFSGSLGYASGSSETTISGNSNSMDYSRFNFSPAVGYTFQENLMAGLRFNIVSQNINGSEDADFGMQLFGRYYIPVEERFLFFPELVIGFANDEIYSPITPYVWPEEPTQVQFGIGPGFAFYPTTHWGIELMAGFLGFTTAKATDTAADPDVEVKQNAFGFNLDATTLHLTISYLLQVKQ